MPDFLDNVTDREARERDDFEAWYAAQMSADTGRDVRPEEIRNLRTPNGFYGDRGYLNGCWVGYLAGRSREEVIDA